MDSLLYVLLMRFELIEEGAELGIVLIAIKSHQSPSKVLSETSNKVRIGAVELQHFPSSQNGLHYNYAS